MRAIRLACCTFVIVVLFVGCENANLASRMESVKMIKHLDADRIINYGNGIFYFDYTGGEFGNALSFFLKTHPQIKVLALTGEVGTAGTIGYFVTFKNK